MVFLKTAVHEMTLFAAYVCLADRNKTTDTMNCSLLSVLLLFFRGFYVYNKFCLHCLSKEGSCLFNRYTARPALRKTKRLLSYKEQDKAIFLQIFPGKIDQFLKKGHPFHSNN